MVLEGFLGKVFTGKDVNSSEKSKFQWPERIAQIREVRHVQAILKVDCAPGSKIMEVLCRCPVGRVGGPGVEFQVLRGLRSG